MSPNPLDPDSYNHRFVTVPSGRRFHVVDQHPEDWRGNVRDAPTILMAHGWPDLWYGWRYRTSLLLNSAPLFPSDSPFSPFAQRSEIAALSKRGYRVICPSQTGYGESSRPSDLEAYTFKAVAYDMNGVLDQLGAGKVVVFGHDCAFSSGFDYDGERED
jgi:soluble epoxide hydrolase/lipid-phosphate phosphatase